MSAKELPRVLCVDDEQAILNGLAVTLRGRCEVVKATSGAAALELCGKSDARFAAVMTDLRMPGMDGVTLLERLRTASPDTVRMLLTGSGDLTAATAAVNKGQVFRFLTKPVAPPVILAAVDAALEQYRLVTAERVLLEETLRGSIRVLLDVLALANPAVSGRALRLRRTAQALVARLQLRDAWPIEVAAMLSQLAWIALPAELLRRLERGETLAAAERTRVAMLPLQTDELLQPIPRIEAVREILIRHAAPKHPETEAEVTRGSVTAIGSEILRLAADYDALETRDILGEAAIDALKDRAARYVPSMLETLVAWIRDGGSALAVTSLPVCEVHVGMVFVEDVRLSTGALLVPRGFEVTTSFIERVQHFANGAVREPVKVRSGAAT